MRYLDLINAFQPLLQQAVKCQGLDLDSLLPDQEMLMKIMVHPLQIQVRRPLIPLSPHENLLSLWWIPFCLPRATEYSGSVPTVCSLLLLLLLLLWGVQASLSEIHSNMWVRNGLQIKGQAMTYVQSHFCNSMIDPDIYLLQVGESVSRSGLLRS